MRAGAEGAEADHEFWRPLVGLLDALPHDPDDVEVTEGHDEEWDEEDVGREEREVDLALPACRVALTPTQVLRAPVRLETCRTHHQTRQQRQLIRRQPQIPTPSVSKGSTTRNGH